MEDSLSDPTARYGNSSDRGTYQQKYIELSITLIHGGCKHKVYTNTVLVLETSLFVLHRNYALFTLDISSAKSIGRSWCSISILLLWSARHTQHLACDTRQEGVEEARGRLRRSRLMMMANYISQLSGLIVNSVSMNRTDLWNRTLAVWSIGVSISSGNISFSLSARTFSNLRW